MPSAYVPSTNILEKYAQVLVNFALNSGQGVKAGEVVELLVPDVAALLLAPLQKAVLQSGAHPMVRVLPTGLNKDFFTYANQEQLTFFPHQYQKARVDLVDHSVAIIADPDPFELAKIDPAKITTARDARQQIREWKIAKEIAGDYTWTCGLWGLEVKATEVGLSLEEYWQQIIKACFLDKADPVQAWHDYFLEQIVIKEKLNSLQINFLKVQGVDADLKVSLGADRSWAAGSGRNIPSFEFFTSPDWRGVEGWIRFNQPLYRYGNVLKDIELTFENGIITKAHASQGNQLLQQLLKSNNANKVGEFSLTDKRHSPITHIMAETLYDENIGGPFGNTHLAIGMAYKDCYRGDPAELSDQDWADKGFNNSPEHTDIISTTDRTVTATLADGSEVVLYANGMFQV